MKTNLNSRVVMLVSLSGVGFIILLAAFWMQRADLAKIKKAYGDLQEQNAGLQKNLAASRAEPAPLEGVAALVRPPAPQVVAPQLPIPHPPEVEPNRLSLAGTHVAAVAGGRLVATLRFTPSKTGPLGLLALTVRMPRNSTARILDLAPAGSATYTESSKEISEDGRFGFFQGTLGDEKEVQVALSLSGPATVSVKGSCGIKPFELAVQAPGKSVRK